MNLKLMNYKFINFIKTNWLIILILLVGAFLRLYKIDQYMTFLGDEGRDSIVVRNLLVHKDLFLIGPGTSVGNMYLGPLYYYLIAIPLALANFSPVGPAVFVALLGVFTIWFVYFVGCEWFSKKAGLIASLLFAVSPTVIIFSHSSWNPNIMPFFALLTVYSVWKFWKKGLYSWLVVLGISFAFCLQSHYLGLLLAPVILLFWVWKVLRFNLAGNWTGEVASFMRMSIFGLITFLFLMSPLLAFDIRHNWLNTNSLVKFVTERETTVSAKPWSALPRIPEIAENISTSLLGVGNKNLGNLILTIVSIPSILFVLSRKKLHKNEAEGFLFLTVWLFFGFIGFGIYKQPIYDHYFGFLFPAIFLFFAGFIDGILENLSKIGVGLIYLLLGFLVIWNISETPILKEPNRQMARAQNVATKIIDESKTAEFNLAVIADSNYEDGYRYFLEKESDKVVKIDAQIEESIKDQLFVVCEKPKEKCDPTHSPKAEVANFGWSKVESVWEVDGVIIYKLVHSKKQ
ncbi:MAG: glycosyltransferase family 39 protein [bacterium]|nr:MAG: glycosyltransferase family 39 protein [bacterium]